MSNNTGNLDALTKRVMNLRKGGKAFEEIADIIGNVSVEEVVSTWHDYIENRVQMSDEEHKVLYELRLEDFLYQANERLDYCTKAEDFEIVLKTLDRIEAFRALNKERKGEATAALEALTRQQSQIILQTFMTMQTEFKKFLETAFEQKTIKAIKGTVLDSFDTTFTTVATKALESTGDLS